MNRRGRSTHCKRRLQGNSCWKPVYIYSWYVAAGVVSPVGVASSFWLFFALLVVSSRLVVAFAEVYPWLKGGRRGGPLLPFGLAHVWACVYRGDGDALDSSVVVVDFFHRRVYRRKRPPTPCRASREGALRTLGAVARVGRPSVLLFSSGFFFRAFCLSLPRSPPPAHRGHGRSIFCASRCCCVDSHEMGLNIVRTSKHFISYVPIRVGRLGRRFLAGW